MPDQAEIHKKRISKKVEDRRETVELLRTHFSSLPDKDQAWQDLLRLVQDKDDLVRGGASFLLGTAFSQMPDKDQAWGVLVCAKPGVEN